MHWRFVPDVECFERTFTDVRLPNTKIIVSYDRETFQFELDIRTVDKDARLGRIHGQLHTKHSEEEHRRVLTALARAALLVEKSPEELRELDEPLQPRKKTKRLRKKKAKKPSNR